MFRDENISGWYCPRLLLSDTWIRASSGKTVESGDEAVQQRGELGALAR
jgi:hypothetical protein